MTVSQLTKAICKCGTMVAFAAGMATGCAVTHDHDSSLAHQAPSLPVSQLGLFSTYPSKRLESECAQATVACKEDSVSPDAFLSALSTAENANRMLAPIQQADFADYQLLIANVGSNTPNSVWSQLLDWTGHGQAPDRQFAEFTLMWRDVELSSQVVSADFKQGVPDRDKAMALIHAWWNSIQDEGIFSTDFLYSSLNASDYRENMSLPSSILAFEQTATELSDDPLLGATSRYTHPEYSDAIVDINVFPILQSLQKSTDQILIEELNKDKQRAIDIAQHRSLQVKETSAVTQFSFSNGDFQGYRLALMASSPTSDDIHASVYVFRQNDKIIKISTTMPWQFSDPLAMAALPQIKVPTESALMATLRKQAESNQRIQ